MASQGLLNEKDLQNIVIGSSRAEEAMITEIRQSLIDLDEERRQVKLTMAVTRDQVNAVLEEEVKNIDAQSDFHRSELSTLSRRREEFSRKTNEQCQRIDQTEAEALQSIERRRMMYEAALSTGARVVSEVVLTAEGAVTDA